jgi:hypothetical protein
MWSFFLSLLAVLPSRSGRSPYHAQLFRQQIFKLGPVSLLSEAAMKNAGSDIWRYGQIAVAGNLLVLSGNGLRVSPIELVLPLDQVRVVSVMTEDDRDCVDMICGIDAYDVVIGAPAGMALQALLRNMRDIGPNVGLRWSQVASPGHWSVPPRR